MKKFATYHRRGWNPTVHPVLAHNEEAGTVDLADDKGVAIVTSLPVLVPGGEIPDSYAVLAADQLSAEEVAQKAADEEAAKKAADEEAARKKTGGKH